MRTLRNIRTCHLECQVIIFNNNSTVAFPLAFHLLHILIWWQPELVICIRRILKIQQQYIISKAFLVIAILNKPYFIFKSLIYSMGKNILAAKIMRFDENSSFMCNLNYFILSIFIKTLTFSLVLSTFQRNRSTISDNMISCSCV